MSGYALRANSIYCAKKAESAVSQWDWQIALNVRSVCWRHWQRCLRTWQKITSRFPIACVTLAKAGASREWWPGSYFSPHP